MVMDGLVYRGAKYNEDWTPVIMNDNNDSDLPYVVRVDDFPFVIESLHGAEHF